MSRRIALSCLVLALNVALLPALERAAAAQKNIVSYGSGTGVYFPATGYYSGPGTDDVFGPVFGAGRILATPLSETTFSAEMYGTGTRYEILERNMWDEGTILTRLKEPGFVELTPIGGDLFVATWTIDTEIVSGTGRFKGAKGTSRAVATNLPFSLTDPEWSFVWTRTWNIRVAGNRRGHFDDH